jgi:hypothetical protein
MQAQENWEALSWSRQEEFIKFAQTLMMQEKRQGG